MAHAFAVVPAKPAFGNFSKHLNYSDIMTAKRANTLYCECTSKSNPYVVNSQSDLINIRKITRQNCADGCDILPFNKSSLEVNLITTMYIPDVVVLAKNATPDVNSKLDPTLTPLYSYYKIDPGNKLTGDTPCGVQKYINYMILDVSAFINTECPDNNVETFCFCKP